MSVKGNVVTEFLAIDIERSEYKILHSFLGFFTIGKWRKMPKILSVAVTQIKLAHSASYRYAYTSEGKTTHYSYCIFLRGKGANIRVYTDEDVLSVREGAEKIAKFIDVPCVDYSQGKS